MKTAMDFFKNGEVLEGTIPDPESGVQKRRYWISVAR
jgi:hypothetical protein